MCFHPQHFNANLSSGTPQTIVWIFKPLHKKREHTSNDGKPCRQYDMWSMPLIFAVCIECVKHCSLHRWDIYSSFSDACQTYNTFFGIKQRHTLYHVSWYFHSFQTPPPKNKVTWWYWQFVFCAVTWTIVSFVWTYFSYKLCQKLEPAKRGDKHHICFTSSNTNGDVVDVRATTTRIKSLNSKMSLKNKELYHRNYQQTDMQKKRIVIMFLYCPALVWRILF